MAQKLVGGKRLPTNGAACIIEEVGMRFPNTT
jgi:hypothetical protein